MRIAITVCTSVLLLMVFAPTAVSDEATELRDAIDAAVLAPPAEARLVRSADGGLDAWTIGGAAKPESPWTREFGVALSMTRGNSDTFDLLVDGKLDYENARWALRNKGAFIYGETEGDKTAEAWHTEHRVERKFSERTYAFLQVGFDRDELADLEYRITGLAGIGRVLAKGNRGSLKGELGGGVIYEKRTGLPTTTDPSAYLGLDYEREWADGSQLTLGYDFIPNLGDWDLSRMTWDLKFAKPLCAEIDLTVNLRVDYVFSPPRPTESVDMLLAVGIRVRL